MGRGIVKNLLESGYTVFVYDIDKQAVERLVIKGAISSNNVISLAKEVDVMILSLPSPALIKKLMLDEVQGQGAFHVMKKGSYIVDMSTNDVGITEELHDSALTFDLEFLDSPVSGGPLGAESGTLTIMVGGNERAYNDVLPVLNAVGNQIKYVGGSGAGQTVKLCHNMVVGGIIALISEALLTGEKAGISKRKVASILQKGSAQTKVMDVFGSNILEDTFEDVKFSLDNMSKDIHLYRNLAENNEVPTFASQSVNQLYQIARNKGKGKLDSTAIYELFSEVRSQDER